MLVNGSMVQYAYPYKIGSIFPGQIRPWNPKADLTVHRDSRRSWNTDRWIQNVREKDVGLIDLGLTEEVSFEGGGDHVISGDF